MQCGLPAPNYFFEYFTKAAVEVYDCLLAAAAKVALNKVGTEFGETKLGPVWGKHVG